MNLYRCLVALVVTGFVSPAFGQYCGEWDPNNPGCWQARRDEEDARRREAEEESRRNRDEERKREEDSAEEWRRSKPQRLEAARQNAATTAANEAALKQLRAKLLTMPPLPPGRNLLLGRWRVAGSDKSRAQDDWSQLQSLLANPGGATCTMLFGEGITEFLPASWASIDSFGNDSLGKIQYRMHDSRAYALPDQGIPLLGFEVVDRNRIREARMPDCELVRVEGQPAAASRTRAARSAASAATASAPVRSTSKPIDPNSPLGRGVRLLGEKEFQPALQQLLVAAQSAPNDPRVYVYLADTYGWLGMDAESNQAAERAKQLDPNAFDALR